MRKRFAVDIEASGFFGYPIEIGWCEIGTSDVQSYLIKPTREWIEDLIWDEVAEGLHGITMDELERDGLDPGKVVEMFLGAIGETPVLFSDAIGFDQRWLDLLFDAAGLRIPFRADPEIGAGTFIPRDGGNFCARSPGRTRRFRARTAAFQTYLTLK